MIACPLCSAGLLLFCQSGDREVFSIRVAQAVSFPADLLAVVNRSWHVAVPRGVGSLTAEPLLLLPLQRLAGEVQAC